MRIKPDVKMSRKSCKRFKANYEAQRRAKERVRKKKLAEVRKMMGSKSND